MPEGFPIENVKYIAPYNWVNAEKPTIVVPGSPATWSGCAVPFKMQLDPPPVSIGKDGLQRPAQASAIARPVVAQNCARLRSMSLYPRSFARSRKRSRQYA